MTKFLGLKKFFRSKKKRGFLGLKKFLGLESLKKEFPGLKGSKKFGEAEKFWGWVLKKFGGLSRKKKAVKKIWGNMAKKGDFRHILEIYGLEQSFFRSKKSKNKV